MSSDSITPEMVQAVARVIAGSRYWNCLDRTEVGVLARQALEAALESVPAKSERLFVDREKPSPDPQPPVERPDLTATNDEFAPMLAELKKALCPAVGEAYQELKAKYQAEKHLAPEPSPMKEPGLTAEQQMQVARMLAVKKRAFMRVFLADVMRSRLEAEPET